MKTITRISALITIQLLLALSSRASEPIIPAGTYILVQTGNPMSELPVEAIVASKEDATTISIPALKIKEIDILSQGVGFYFTTGQSLSSGANDITLFAGTASQKYDSSFEGYYSIIRYGKNFETSEPFKGSFILVPTSKIIRKAQQDAAANP